MPEELSLPTVRYYPDGGAITVTTQEEYDALAPGHAAHPDGPFPDPAPTPPASRAGGRRHSGETPVPPSEEEEP